MVKSIGLLVVALALLLPILAGCGGSDAIGNNVVPPPVDTTRTISGTIARADTGAGLPDVLVRLGATDKTSVSGASGEFSFTVSKTSDIPVFFQVDTSSAGAAYPPGNVVRYKSQNFLPTQIDIPVSVLNGDTNVLGTVSVYNASGDVPVPPPFASKNTIIVGKIVSKKTGAPIKDVTVRFGPDRFYSAISGARGFFGVDIGKNVPLLTIYPTATGSFQVDTTTAGSDYPDTFEIIFRSVNYDQNAVSVPVDLMTGEATYLGVLTVVDDGSGGGGPPPPPM